MNRRQLLAGSGAAALSVGLSRFPFSGARAEGPRKRILMFTRSEGFEHPVVRRRGDKLSLAEMIASEQGARHGFDVDCTKDGRVFLPENLARYDAFLFMSQGDLCKEKSVDGQPPMPPEGKQALLQAVAAGKGFVGCHCASDTFHSPGYPRNRWQVQPRDQVDPYIRMLGGEFAGHGEQQRAWMRLVDRAFPACRGLNDFGLLEEWYSLKNFAPDLHVILVQETEGMRNFDYQRPNYPATWARQEGKGRVFFTSMGHREDVWSNPIFQQILFGGLAWAVGRTDADITPNMDKITPQAGEMPREKK